MYGVLKGGCVHSSAGALGLYRGGGSLWSWSYGQLCVLATKLRSSGGAVRMSPAHPLGFSLGKYSSTDLLNHL